MRKNCLTIWCEKLTEPYTQDGFEGVTQRILRKGLKSEKEEEANIKLNMDITLKNGLT